MKSRSKAMVEYIASLSGATRPVQDGAVRARLYPKPDATPRDVTDLEVTAEANPETDTVSVVMRGGGRVLGVLKWRGKATGWQWWHTPDGEACASTVRLYLEHVRDAVDRIATGVYVPTAGPAR